MSDVVLNEIEQAVLELISGLSTTNIEDSIKELFATDENLGVQTLEKIRAHCRKMGVSANVCNYNTMSIKERLRQYEPQEIQVALAFLKSKNRIIQLGRGRGRGFAYFYENDNQAATVNEAATQIEAAQTPHEDKNEDTNEETTKQDGLDILEDALDTVYKLFQRKQMEEQDQLKEIDVLKAHIHTLSKKVQELEEKQDELDLITWR